MAKRTATTDLNHDNWDREDEPEEAGTFSRASDDIIKKRVIKTARRRNPLHSEDGEKKCAFSSFSFGKNPQPNTAMPVFGFLENLQKNKPIKTNGIKETQRTEKTEFKFSSTTDKSSEFKSLTAPTRNDFGNTNNEKIGNAGFTFLNTAEQNSENINFTFGKQNDTAVFSTNKDPVENKGFTFTSVPKSTPTQHMAGNTTKSLRKNDDLDRYYCKLKGLNESVSKWIQNHVNQNPLINLQPIFRDYEKYLDELEKEKQNPKDNDEMSKGPSFDGSKYANTSSETTQNEPTLSFSFGQQQKSTSLSASNNSLSSTPSIPQFSFGAGTPSNTGFFSTPSVNTVQPFGLTSSIQNQPTKDNEEDTDEVPKVEVKEITEEGHIYTIRCKVFVKKDGSFSDRGVGNLYLKPVPNSEKIQLIVRAHTNLGNLLCNFILSKSIPTQKQGKNNVMLVCIPTPDSKPPPVPVLLRVKTEEDANNLLDTLEKHKK